MFTVLYLKSLKPQKSPYRVYEKSSRSGFGIQVSTQGSKTFFYAYTINKKARFIKLGLFAHHTNQTIGCIRLKEAGLLWQKWYRVRHEGHDPQMIRDNEIEAVREKYKQSQVLKQERLQQGTYQQLLDAYINWLKANNKRSAANVAQVINANAYTIIEPSTKAKDITPQDINATLAVMEQRGSHTSSNRLRSYLLTAFKKGIALHRSGRQIHIVIEFGLESNPVADVPKSEIKENVGERFLSEHEIRILWEELPKTKISPQIIAVLKLMIITGQRVEEVLGMNHNDIDIKAQCWELHKTKSNRPHIVPLAAMAIEMIIDELHPCRKGFLFTSSITAKLIRADSLPQACQRFCQQTGFTKFSPRDLRRTWKTLTGKAGISKFDRDRYQNHLGNDVSSRHYDRYDYLAEKRQVAKVWNAYLSDILKRN